MLNKAIISFSNSTFSNDTFIVFTIYKDNINFEIWESYKVYHSTSFISPSGVRYTQRFISPPSTRFKNVQ